MSRHNQIPLRMKVEGMRLVPASSFDQEALATYQKGAVLQVYLWQGRNPDLLRKFWAIVGKVVETCKTPWEDKEEAADALKLALGITDVGSTVNGQMFVRPGSISFSAMDESRFRKFFEDSMALLSRITGVDVTELGKEAADTGPDHDPTGELIENNSGVSPSPDADEPPHNSSSAEPADSAPLLAGSPHTDASDTDGGLASDKAGDGVSSSPSSPARDPETETLIQFAKDVLTTAAAYGSSLDAVKAIEQEYAAHIRLMNASGVSRARSISSSARAILEGSESLRSAVEFFSEVLPCRADEIGG